MVPKILDEYYDMLRNHVLKLGQGGCLFLYSVCSVCIVACIIYISFLYVVLKEIAIQQ